METGVSPKRIITTNLLEFNFTLDLKQHLTAVSLRFGALLVTSSDELSKQNSNY